MKALPAAIAADVSSVGMISSAVHTLRGESVLQLQPVLSVESRAAGSFQVLIHIYIWI